MIHVRTLGATPPPNPKAARAALVSKLAIVMGQPQAEATVTDLETTVAAAAQKAVTPLVVKTLLGVLGVNVVFFLLSRLYGGHR